MEILEEIDSIREKLSGHNEIGFVPTMGYLHEGHLSLVRNALVENETVVVSIFVNPTQFGPDEDYDDYPRDLKKDARILRDMGVDYIFTPRVEDMYPEDYCTYVEVEELTEYLCGARRPGHFRGVTTVVCKLFNIIQPDRAYFGQKDFQQYVVIKRMVRDLHLPVEIRRVPIVREEDGLALSSRNEYLTEEQREAATILYKSLSRGKEMILSGERDARKVQEVMSNQVAGEKLAEIDYVAVVDPEKLTSLTVIKDRVLLAEAVFIGKARLIDNMYLELDQE